MKKRMKNEVEGKDRKEMLENDKKIDLEAKKQA